MSNKLIRVNINHHGFIASLGCYGPVKNILLNERQINNIKRILGEDKVQLVNPPKKVISPKQAEELKRIKQKPVTVKPEEIAEIIEIKPEPVQVEEVQPQPVEVKEEAPIVVEEPVQVEEVQPQPVEQPKPAPRRRGGRKPAAKKVEEAPIVVEEPVEE